MAYQNEHLRPGATALYNSTAVVQGEVVPVGDTVLLATQDVALSVDGSMCAGGLVRIVKENGAIAAGALCYWNDTGNPQGGTAGSGCVTDTKSGTTHKLIGHAIKLVGATDETVDIVKRASFWS